MKRVVFATAVCTVLLAGAVLLTKVTGSTVARSVSVSPTTDDLRTQLAKERRANRDHVRKLVRLIRHARIRHGGFSPTVNRSIAMSLVRNYYGWTGRQWNALRILWQRESGWRLDATNGSSGAYGIPQALPGSKMRSKGRDWRTNPATQIAWGASYIRSVYRNPVNALAHSYTYNWY